MKKVRKFSNGGMDDYDSSDDAKNLILAAEREDVERIGEDFAKSMPKKEPVAAPKAMSFKEAFAKHRAAGDKTFEWNGKKYTTEMASDKKRSPAASVPTPNIAEGRTASGMPREARGVADKRTAGQKYADRQVRAADVMRRAAREQYGFKSGGSVGSASKRADGCAIRGKTRGRMM